MSVVEICKLPLRKPGRYTDRLHKFLAIAGTALFILGVTIPLDRYDQSVRQFIEAKTRVMELGEAQLRLSKWIEAQTRVAEDQLHATKEALNNTQQNSLVVAPDRATKLASGVDHASVETEAAKLEREIADVSVQARKQGDLAEHADRIRAIWLVLGCICILGGIVLAVLGFAMWWRQSENDR